MPTFPAIFDLASIDGANGFRISGAAQYDWLGFSTASADLNHDGVDDLVITPLNATGGQVASAWSMSSAATGPAGCSDRDTV